MSYVIDWSRQAFCCGVNKKCGLLNDFGVIFCMWDVKAVTTDTGYIDLLKHK